MKNKLIDALNKTPLKPLLQYRYDYFYYKNLRKHFWDWTEDDEKKKSFYSQFVSQQDIVFDVGANLGNRSKIFSEIGSTVIAIEPQKLCTKFLQSVFKSKNNVHIVRMALGAEPGQEEMMLSNAHTISSLSADWVESVKNSGRFSEYNWDRKSIVEVDTLDNLIKEYGQPSFIKIDVEGFEEQVLQGLSEPVKGISFEFTYEFLSNAYKCIEVLNSISGWKFQLDLGESMEFYLPGWVGSDEIIEHLDNLPHMAYGDLFAVCTEI